MEIRPLTRADALEYPSLVALSCGVQSTECDDEGNLHSHTAAAIGDTSDRPRIESAIYDNRHNTIAISCRAHDGTLSVYNVHLDSGAREMKGRRTLTCKVLSLSMKAHGRKVRGELETMNGVKLRMTRLKHESAVEAAVNSWVHKLPNNPDFLTSEFPDVEPKLRRRLLGAQQKGYWSPDFKMRIIQNEICSTITGWLQERISVQDAINWKLLPDYPVVELAYSLFHKYDKEEKLTFQGLFLPHDDTAHKLNLQTAERVSRAMGETVTVEDLSQAVHSRSLPSIIIGGHTAYCLATATKTTKEVT